MTFADFTEDEFDDLVRVAAEQYRFIGYDELDADPPAVLWRHDVDYSPQRARALARLEARRGVRATYFVNLHSDFYNALEPDPAEAFRDVVAHGHALGVHFDPHFVARVGGDADEWLRRDRELLEQVFETEVRAFSTHNPTLASAERRDAVHGLVNVYGPRVWDAFAYCSDSNGIWRFRPLREMLDAHANPRLHVLTHPGWWVPEPMPPRARISRAIEGRAAAAHARYDRLLEESGRPNVR